MWGLNSRMSVTLILPVFLVAEMRLGATLILSMVWKCGYKQKHPVCWFKLNVGKNNVLYVKGQECNRVTVGRHFNVQRGESVDSGGPVGNWKAGAWPIVTSSVFPLLLTLFSLPPSLSPSSSLFLFSLSLPLATVEGDCRLSDFLSWRRFGVFKLLLNEPPWGFWRTRASESSFKATTCRQTETVAVDLTETMDQR